MTLNLKYSQNPFPYLTILIPAPTNRNIINPAPHTTNTCN